jgi:hypothetical protein
MSVTSERCPTCDETGFIMRGADRVACPTCSPSINHQGEVLASADDKASPSGIWLLTILFLGAIAVVGMMALFALGQQVWR